MSTEQKGLFLSVCVNDIKLAGKTENITPTWKILMKDVDLEEPTSVLDHVNLGCAQRECKISDEVVTKYRDMFEARISAGAKEEYQQELQGNLMQKQYLLLVLRHGRSCKEMRGKILRICE